MTEAAAMDKLRFMYTATITIKSNDAVHAAVAASRPAFWSSRRKRRADDFAALDAAVSAQDADFPAQDATKAARTASVVAAQDARRAANFASAAEKSRWKNYLAACAARIAVDRATDASAIEAAHIAYVVAWETFNATSQIAKRTKQLAKKAQRAALDAANASLDATRANLAVNISADFDVMDADMAAVDAANFAAVDAARAARSAQRAAGRLGAKVKYRRMPVHIRKTHE